MRRLSLFDKVVFVLNVISAFSLFLACFAPYISVKNFPILSFLSLMVPLLAAINLLFLFYWLLRRKRQLKISLFTLLIAFFAFGFFVRLGFSQKEPASNDLKIMSFNVRKFNVYGHLSSSTVNDDIQALVRSEDPDIICFQEVGYKDLKGYMGYPYQHVEKTERERSFLGVFSKYPIVRAELIDLPESLNNASFADIVFKSDTIRIYNIHLQSLGITPGTGALRNESSERLYGKLSHSFKKQEEQAKILLEHGKSVDYKKIVCGDFNNTEFSRGYHIIKGNKNDTFKEKGSGYGRTFIFHGLPLRIDFILADPEFEVTSHKTFDEELSDHYPISASFDLKED